MGRVRTRPALSWRKKTDQKKIDLKSGSEESVTFDVVMETPGWVDGEMKLSGDRLAADDAFYFPLKVNDKVKVLIVDGDPTPALKESESYYLSQALHRGTGGKRFPGPRDHGK